MAALMKTVGGGNGGSPRQSVLWAAVGSMAACIIFLLATHPITGAPLSGGARTHSAADAAAAEAAALEAAAARLDAADPATLDATLMSVDGGDAAGIPEGPVDLSAPFVDPLAQQPADPAAQQPADPAADPAAADAQRTVAGGGDAAAAAAAAQPSADGLPPAPSPADIAAQLATEEAAAVEAAGNAAKAAAAGEGAPAEEQERRAEEARKAEQAAWQQACPADCHKAEGFAHACKRGRCICVLGRGGPDCTFNLQRLYFDRPIYSDLEGSPEFRPLDLQGWSPGADMYEKYLEEVDAVTVVEIGVWKGVSSIHMAKWLKKKGRGMLLAVDTWLGAAEFLGDAQRAGMDGERQLAPVHGWPTVYYTFLSNVVHSNVADVIVPLAQTSLTATTVMFRMGLTADFIHIDGAHEYGPVREDIRVWWPYVRYGGILMGDDFNWAGVSKAIREFSAQCDVPFIVDGVKWVVRKPDKAWFDANNRLPYFCLGLSKDHLAGGGV